MDPELGVVVVVVGAIALWARQRAALRPVPVRVEERRRLRRADGD